MPDSRHPEADANPSQTAEQIANVVSRTAFPQWAGVMEKSWAWDAMFNRLCDEIVGRSCNLDIWQAKLDTLRDSPRLHQLIQVNQQINAVRYRDDIDAWGVPDYWAAPGEFFANGGDCEDYAIAKYYSLRKLGFTSEQMRIVVLRDNVRQAPHAVLVVKSADRELVLDNMNDNIVPWSSLPDYQPYYSINEETYQLHDERDLS